MKVSWLKKSFHPVLGREPCWVFSFPEESTVCAVPIIDRPGSCVSSYVFSGQWNMHPLGEGAIDKAYSSDSSIQLQLASI
ncbi:unnamed protein product [Brassica oleracea]|uniref:(rape) hypothetical protein n=1 Tax=Brassica napus TaxID=3708 RepID=A0A816K3A2_BRANA|nr:unnamed protein product [Brassica napus]